MARGSFVFDVLVRPIDETHLGTERSHFRPTTQSARNELPRRMVAVGQTGGFDYVGTHQFDLPGILLRAVAGNAKQSPPRQPRIKEG
jgi:hypothetical protein